MKQLTRAAAALVLVLAFCVPAFAHGTNAHVRGVVTQVTAKSVTVQLADNTTKTLTLNSGLRRSCRDCAQKRTAASCGCCFSAKFA